MQWWNDFWGWLTSQGAQPVIFTAVVLLVSIVVAGLLSAWIARGAIRGVLSRAEREQKAAAVAALVDAAVEASVWNSLTPGEQVLSDRSVGQVNSAAVKIRVPVDLHVFFVRATVDGPIDIDSYVPKLGAHTVQSGIADDDLDSC